MASSAAGRHALMNDTSFSSQQRYISFRIADPRHSLFSPLGKLAVYFAFHNFFFF